MNYLNKYPFQLGHRNVTPQLVLNTIMIQYSLKLCYIKSYIIVLSHTLLHNIIFLIPYHVPIPPNIIYHNITHFSLPDDTLLYSITLISIYYNLFFILIYHKKILKIIQKNKITRQQLNISHYVRVNSLQIWWAQPEIDEPLDRKQS